MRIIAGEFRSRVLKTLEGDNTRPTTDRLREALFSRLGPYFERGSVLDLFAGSGAIALEALSRGFDRAVMCDSNRRACEVIRSNVAALKVEDRCMVWQCDYRRALERLNEQFDLIYLDPPYKFEQMNALLQDLQERELLKEDGVIVAETLRDATVEVSAPLYIEKEAVYGISKITYIKRSKV